MRYIILVTVLFSSCFAYSVGNSSYKMSGILSINKNAIKNIPVSIQNISRDKYQIPKKKINVYISKDNPDKKLLLTALKTSGISLSEIIVFEVVSDKLNSKQEEK